MGNKQGKLANVIQESFLNEYRIGWNKFGLGTPSKGQLAKSLIKASEAHKALDNKRQENIANNKEADADTSNLKNIFKSKMGNYKNKADRVVNKLMTSKRYYRKYGDLEGDILDEYNKRKRGIVYSKKDQNNNTVDVTVSDLRKDL